MSAARLLLSKIFLAVFAFLIGWSGRLYVRVFAFPFVKTVTREQLCRQLVKPVVCMGLCLSTRKNRNAGAVVPAAGAFLLAKIVRRGQLVYLCQQIYQVSGICTSTR